jgi:hypothetical protein
MRLNDRFEARTSHPLGVKRFPKQDPVSKIQLTVPPDCNGRMGVTTSITGNGSRWDCPTKGLNGENQVRSDCEMRRWWTLAWPVPLSAIYWASDLHSMMQVRRVGTGAHPAAPDAFRHFAAVRRRAEASARLALSALFPK